MFTAAAPIVSSGWRTVVKDGTESPAMAMSSKPITEHCSGHAYASLGQARGTAPSAVRSSNAKKRSEFLFLLQQFLSQAVTMLENLHWHRTRRVAVSPVKRSISSFYGLREFPEWPRHLGAESIRRFGPRIIAMRPVTELIEVLQRHSPAGFIVHHRKN